MIMEIVTDKVGIRSALEKDCPAIKAVALAAYSVYLERMQVKPFPMLDDYLAHIRHERVYVLECENVIHGYVVFIAQDSNNLLLDNLAVDPASQGRGYGARLVCFAETWGKKHGCRQVTLYTNAIMTENLSWYQRLGYSVTHKAVENGYSRIYMAKML